MKFSVYSANHGWLTDTCAGGTWSWDVVEAMWFDSEDEARSAIEPPEFTTLYGIIRVK